MNLYMMYISDVYLKVFPTFFSFFQDDFTDFLTLCLAKKRHSLDEGINKSFCVAEYCVDEKSVVVKVGLSSLHFSSKMSISVY